MVFYILVVKTGFRGGLIVETDARDLTSWRNLQGSGYTRIGKIGVGRPELVFSGNLWTLNCWERTRDDRQGQVSVRDDLAIALYNVNGQVFEIGGFSSAMQGVSGQGNLVLCTVAAAFQGTVNWQFIQHP